MYHTTPSTNFLKNTEINSEIWIRKGPAYFALQIIFGRHILSTNRDAVSAAQLVAKTIQYTEKKIRCLCKSNDRVRMGRLQ